ncbi:uncharacterized protein LOC143026351 [Oratosquilla oratoria]|uniref:uncharacterized protein LOC143026351 n=1 Tax=Oratosquilla oratoria TaxID=337810 RepID=UPI003F766F23
MRPRKENVLIVSTCLAALWCAVKALPAHNPLLTDGWYTPDNYHLLPQHLEELYKERAKTSGCRPGAGNDWMRKEMLNTMTVGCDTSVGEVLWPSTGRCERVMTRGPCEIGLFVMVDRSTGQPVCRPRPCEASQVLFRGSCIPALSHHVCPKGMMLQPNEYGENECDCPLDKVFYRGDGSCVTPYSQGPCPPGQVIKIEDSGSHGRARCVPNDCPAPNMVRIDSQCYPSTAPTATCYTLNTPGPCQEGTLRLDITYHQPTCLAFSTHALLANLPPVSCPRGSYRDSLTRRCRINFADFFKSRG